MDLLLKIFVFIIELMYSYIPLIIIFLDISTLFGYEMYWRKENSQKYETLYFIKKALKTADYNEELKQIQEKKEKEEKQEKLTKTATNPQDSHKDESNKENTLQTSKLNETDKNASAENEMKAEEETLLVKKDSSSGLRVYTLKDLKAFKAHNKQVVLYQNYFINIEDWISYHPGGLIHLEKTLHKEIGRFICGNDPINGKFLPYDHSFFAQRFLLENVFGVLKHDHKIIINSMVHLER